MILKEFLVALGLKDNMSEKLKKSMDNADSKVSKFVRGFAKKFALAGTAVATFTATATAGLAKFATSIVKSDDELTAFSKKFGLSRDEAYKTKSALDVMGKSLEEVQLDPKLLEQFNELKANTANLKVPDNTDGLKTVRAITTSVLSLKQTATNALQWVGHSFLKYVQKPMEDIQHLLKSFNDTIKRNIPDWADKIGKALSWVVQLGGTVIRAGTQMLGVVKKVFDAIPSGVKIAMAALGGLAAFIKMGPIGRLITIISSALLLLDDFFTFLDGGDSLLGPVWQTLTDFFSGFEESGKTALSFFSENFLPKLVDYISKIFPRLAEKVLSYVDPFIDWAVEVLGGIIDAIAAAIPELLKLAGNIALAILDGLLSKLPKLLDGVTKILRSIINAVKEMIPELLAVAGNIISQLISIIVEALPDILDAAIQLVMAVVDGITDALPDILTAVVELFDKLLVAIIDNLPKIIDMGIQLVEKLSQGILKALPKLAEAAINLIKKLLATLVDHLPELIKAGVQMIKSLIDGFLRTKTQIIKTIIDLITQLLEAIADMLPDIIDAGIELLMSLIEGIVEAIPQLVQTIVDLIPVIVQAVIDNLPKIIQAGLQIIIALAEGLIKAIPKLVAAIPQIVGSILEGLGTALTGVLDIGKNIVESLWNGISSMGNWIKEKVGGFFSGIWDGVTGFFGGLFGGDDKSKKSEGHAEGGVFTKEHYAEFAEDDKPEAVIPLTKPKRAADVLKQAADFMTGNIPSTPSSGKAQPKTASNDCKTDQAEGEQQAKKSTTGKLETVAQALITAIQKLADIISSLGKGGSKAKESGGQKKPKFGGFFKATNHKEERDSSNADYSEIVDRILAFLDNAEKIMAQMAQLSQSTTAYNSVSNSNVSYNTTNIDNKQSYTINDTSGNPRTTAEMVGRTQELHSRNLKGVFA